MTPHRREVSRPREPVLLAAVRDGHSMHEAISALCRSAAFEVRFCSNVDDALASVRVHGAPSIVLVESTLHIEADGLEICRALRAAPAPTWLILATPPEAIELRLEAFRIGVDDCVSASLDARELEALVAARLEQLERASGTYEIRHITLSNEHAIAARARALATAFELGPRETQILEMLARGLSPKEIGPLLGCSYATVRTHLRRSSKKLACSGTRELILRFFSDG